MSSKLDSPVQTQMAVAVFKSPIGREYHGNDRKPTGSRRVFVQTENGCVLGMELDRNDNAHMVKRRLQIALNVPVEESSLTFGDMVLKNDLSAIRNDSPLLLTRNLMHRSSSTPCLSPSGRDVQQRDRSGPIEILCQSGGFSRTKELVNEIVMALKAGVDPIQLVRKLNSSATFGQQVELIPIDHGLCLPESLEDPYFEWIHWPQASIPFSEDELDYIKALDPYRDSDMLRNELPMIREACLRVLTLCTIFLKEAAGYGLCLAEIGEMMTREFRRGEEEPSELEVLCMEARRVVAEREMFMLSPKTEPHEDGVQFEIDCDDSEIPVNPIFSFHFGPGRNPLSKLEEEDEHEEHEELVLPAISGKVPSVSNVSMSLKKNLSLGDSSAGHRSATEQLPASASFVKVADMTDDEWGLFLETLQGLLHRTFVERKSGAVGQRQRQRLGTSCQF
ncbi:putative 1-phosphatidylinositol 4-kinase [Helianthus debilis subsp. tardiflorus]